ncbi:hypothetical protein [Niabella drilacis]|uniref:Lipocalin-like domain-containing protein n=1 Tax=Niabella drilacis (strain DSM 25811 / CCM 8410 / CCUG 62505 / LMG 26954 / E90) TaxID=1285928 RepID=A0A1G6IY13_NIADE|nr:hypothetical protein [Niabella drilacis]SDC11408.1 hypothetical protein SAMN04487894_101363 [Niabella drilacis]
MKKWYLPVLLITLLAFTGCSKDLLKRYEKRIVGDWDVEVINLSGSGGLPVTFGEGSYHFSEDRSFTFTSLRGIQYNGNWKIQKYGSDDNCSGCSSNNIHSLLVSAADGSGELKSDYFNTIRFSDTDNQFSATMVNGTRSAVFKFSRK